MLPSHLQSSNRTSQSDHISSAQGSRGGLPLGLTGVLCDTRTLALPHGTLQYTIFRPRHLQYRPPLICVAGGPLLPSTYLSPLAHLVTDRSIVLFDAIGCGQSTASSSRNRTATTDTRQFVNDMILEVGKLIEAIECDEYYLYAHSFGGVLVYEYLKQQHTNSSKTPPTRRSCRGVIFSSVPWSIPDCQSHCQVLSDRTREALGPDADDDDVSRAFSEQHECRTRPLPFPLQQAFQLAGFTSSSSAAGLKAVSDYRVEMIADESVRQKLPPVLILRGEFDFITSEMCHDWVQQGFGPSGAKCMTLAGCSHYGMVEQETLYGSVLSSFLKEHDPPMKPLFPSKQAPTK